MVCETSVGWKVIYCNTRAEKEILPLPTDLQADFAHLFGLIHIYGLENLQEPYLRRLTEKLWVLRLKGRRGIARSTYVTAYEKRIVILHSFIKKTQQTLRDAFDIALRCAKEEGYL